jgi:hypothetical protein
MTEGARLAARVPGPLGWPPERLQRCMDACEQHHALRSRMAMGLEVELVRQADLVDVTAGIVSFGLGRRWLRALFRDVPRDGLWRLAGGSVLGELRLRPASLTGVFFSPPRTRLQAMRVALCRRDEVRTQLTRKITTSVARSHLVSRQALAGAVAARGEPLAGRLRVLAPVTLTP